MIIIAGVPRSGKSIVGKTIVSKFPYSYLPFDSIVSTFNDLYPEIGITHYDDYKIVSKKVAPFIAKLIEHLNYDKVMMILDLYQLTPGDIRKNKIDTNSTIVYLGYPNIDLEQKCHLCN